MKLPIRKSFTTPMNMEYQELKPFAEGLICFWVEKNKRQRRSLAKANAARLLQLPRKDGRVNSITRLTGPFKALQDNERNGHVNILEELYFGNVNPNIGSFDKGSPYGKAMKIISNNEDKLMELLEGKQKELLIGFSNAQCELKGITAVNKFTLGFRLGALIMADVFTSPGNGVMK